MTSKKEQRRDWIYQIDDTHAFNLLVQWLYTGQMSFPKRTQAAKSTKAITEDHESGSVFASVQSSDWSTLPFHSLPYIPSAPKQIGSDDEGADGELYPIDTRSHLKLYVLADKLDMRVLENQTIDVIMQAGYGTKRSINDRWGRGVSYTSLFCFDPETIIWIYQNTLPGGSPLRKLASTSTAYNILLKSVKINHYEECLHGDVVTDVFDAIGENAENAITSRTTSFGSQCLYHDHQGEACNTIAAGASLSDYYSHDMSRQRASYGRNSKGSRRAVQVLVCGT